MGSSGDPTPSVEIFKQLALTCEEIEVAVRSGQNVDIEAYVARFPSEYQELIRPELQEVLAELRVPSGLRASYQPDGGYEALHEYSVLDQIAQGGMGRILVAWDEKFSRQVALKEIQPDSADDQRYQKRFLQESLITARLEHPGILPIYSLGVNSDDQPFYTMRLVSGENSKTLTQAIKELHQHSLDKSAWALLRRRLLRQLIDVCNTVAYAHSQGVCHRDLKPANILIGPFGETLVVDWGLAKFYKDPNPLPKSRGAGLFKKSSDASIDDSSSPPLSRTHSDGAGTRGYVAPECYREEPIVDWPRLDVYSLGAILYCILTGQSPGGESKTSSVEKLGKYPFPTPRRINPDVPKALGKKYL